MIKKILKLKNVGLYAPTPNSTCGDWNGEFFKNTIIYGENGTGKTTLSLLFTSLKGSNEILSEKSTIGTDGIQEVTILLKDDTVYKYKNCAWENHFTNIEIFDVHFIEDNVYIGSSLPDSNQGNLFNIIVDKKGLKILKELENYYENKRDWSKRKKFLQDRLSTELELPDEVIKDIKKQIEHANFEIGCFTNAIKYTNSELGEHSKSVFDNHIESINKYLKKFAPHIRLQEFSKNNIGEKQFVSYSLSVNDEIIGFEKKRGIKRSVKYSLSEGDKSAFAFAFFLAQLEKIDLENKIVVFDDPLSSFDQSRRSATLNQLIRISECCKQLFVLTHSIDFAKMLFRKLDKASTISLKIQKKSNGNTIIFHDIEAETLDDLFKDITVLNNYISNGAKDELEKRKVIRCIRPSIEGIIRIKFFKEIKRDNWLGDMINKIRVANEEDRLFRLQGFLAEIVEVNDYSKEYHHSDPTNPSGNMISDEELRSYVEQTLHIIDKI